MRREKMKKQLYLSKMKRREQRRQKHTAKDNVLSLSINHSLEERHDRHRQQYSPTVSCEEEDEDDSDLDGQEGLLGEIPLSAGVARSGYGTRTHSAFLVPTIRQVGVSPGRVTGSWIASHQQPQIPYSEEEEEDEEERVENEEGDLEDEEAAQDHPRRGRGEGSIGRTPGKKVAQPACVFFFVVMDPSWDGGVWANVSDPACGMGKPSHGICVAILPCRAEAVT